LNAVHILRFQHSIKTLCRVLQVNRSTYYKHFSSPPAPRTIENQEIRSKILTLYSSSDKRMGVYKISKRLAVEYGIHISSGRVYRLMKSMNLPKMSTVKPAFKPLKADNSLPCPNVLKQKFTTAKPNLVWVSDITYIKVNGKFRYLCVIIDLFSRKVISYSVSNKPDAELVTHAFRSAYAKRNPAGTLIFHSDRGCQYTSKKFRSLLDSFHVVQSFSAKGYPYDNAVAESFFKYLKLEETNRRSYYSTEELKLSLFQYIEGYYNKKRPHSANNMLSPDEKEALCSIGTLSTIK
jgi:putative transposase